MNFIKTEKGFHKIIFHTNSENFAVAFQRNNSDGKILAKTPDGYFIAETKTVDFSPPKIVTIDATKLLRISTYFYTYKTE